MVPHTRTKVVKMTFILGDSMIKHTKGWEISSKIDLKHGISVRSFSDAKVRSMKDNVKPCVRPEPRSHNYARQDQRP